MDVTLLCHCCLRGAPERAMTTPYSHLGKTETYADLLRDCFDINLVPVESGSNGICWACVGRLRDASDFKLQVQHSQAELQKASLHIEYDVKSEPADDIADDGDALDVLKEEPVEESEIVDEEETSQLLDEQPVEKSEILVVDEEETSQELHDQPVEELEIVDEEETSQESRTHAQPVEELEIVDEEETSQESHEYIVIVGEEETSQELPEDPAIQLDSWDDVTSDAGSSTAGKRKIVKSAMLKYATVVVDDDGTPTYACKECGNSFGVLDSFRQHYKNVHLKLRKKTYRCVLCPAELLPWLRAKHMEEEHGWKAPTCGVCDKKFAYPNQLDRHTRFYHMGEPLFQCGECGKAFPTRMALKKHLYTHSDVRDVACEFCSKTFKNLRNQRRHMRIHLNDKRYACHVCMETFVQWGNMKYHMTRHHPGVPITIKTD